MTIGGFTISELAQLITMAGVVFMIARGIVTKRDCEKCKTETEEDLDKGSENFKEIRGTLADHGEQIAGIGSTVSGVADNVQILVTKAIGNGGG